MYKFHFNDAKTIFFAAIFCGVFGSVFSLFLIKLGINSQLVFAVKDIPVYIASTFLIKYWLRNYGVFLMLCLITMFLFLIIISHIFIGESYSAISNNIRQMIAPLVLVVIFCSTKINNRDYALLRKIVSLLTIAVFSYGIIEQAFELWVLVDLSKYFNLKGIPVDGRGLSYMFYEPMIGYRERMTSFFLDPIACGHYFASYLIFYTYSNNKSKIDNISAVAALLGLILTFSKGAIMQLLLGVIILNYNILIPVRIAFSLGILFFVSNLKNKDGILIHVNGFLNSLETITFFGHGIGSSGNYSKMFNENLSKYYELGISDSFSAAIIGQSGFVGFVFWLTIILMTPKICSNSILKIKSPVVLLSSMVIISVLSENTMNVTSFICPAVFIGLLARSYILED